MFQFTPVKYKKITLLASLAASLFVVASKDGFAGPVSVYCLNCATSAQAGTIQAAITAGNTAIVGAIQGMSTATTTATSESAKIISESAIKNAAEQEKIKIDSKYTLPNPCSLTASARTTPTEEVTRQMGSGRGGGGSSRPARKNGASAEMLDVIAASEGKTPMPMPEVVAAKAAAGACSSYASGAERKRLCAGARFTTLLTLPQSGLPDADTKAETLFDGPQTAANVATGGVVRHYSISPVDSAERTAVAAFIRNMETPVDLRSLRDKEVDSTSGRNYMAMRDAYDAVMSVTTKPLRDQEALLIADRKNLSQVNQWLAGQDANYIRGWLNSTYPSWQTNGISQMELMVLEANRRFKNKDWIVRMVAADDRQLLLEQVQMQAYQIYQQNLVLERMQQANIIAGVLAGTTLRQEKMPQLVALHRSAQRQ